MIHVSELIQGESVRRLWVQVLLALGSASTDPGGDRLSITLGCFLLDQTPQPDVRKVDSPSQEEPRPVDHLKSFAHSTTAQRVQGDLVCEYSSPEL